MEHTNGNGDLNGENGSGWKALPPYQLGELIKKQRGLIKQLGGDIHLARRAGNKSRAQQLSLQVCAAEGELRAMEAHKFKIDHPRQPTKGPKPQHKGAGRFTPVRPAPRSYHT